MLLYALVLPLGILFGEWGYKGTARRGITYCTRSASWGFGTTVMFTAAHAATVATLMITEQPPFSSWP